MTPNNLGAYTLNTIIAGCCLEVMRKIPDGCIHMCVTSPPYFGLRDYNLPPSIWGGDNGCNHDWIDTTYVRNSDKSAGLKQKTNIGSQGRDKPVENAFCSICGAWCGCLGLEPTYQHYVEHLTTIMHEVKRILRDDGILFLNLGDSYATTSAGNRIPSGFQQKSQAGTSGALAQYGGDKRSTITGNLKPKDMVGIPWRVAFALQEDGWYLRSDIIWHKTNPMPESIQDRPTKAHEYVFLLAKSKKYFYDDEAIKEPLKCPDAKGIPFGGIKKAGGDNPTYSGNEYDAQSLTGRNRRTVWTIATKPFRGAHFAVMPQALVEPCILAGTSARGCCPKCGAPYQRVRERNYPSPTMRDGEWEKDASRMGIVGTENRGGRPRVGLDRKTAREKSPGYTTLGWRPTCKCSGLTIIGKQPRKPSQKENEPDIEYTKRLTVWEVRLDNWLQLWNRLKPLYDVELTTPAIVLDPFMGAGTTALTALQHNRNYLGIELNPEYIKIAENRLEPITGIQPELMP